MEKDFFLPKGFELLDGSKIKSLLYAGNDWQILDTNGSNNILIACPDLAKKWNDLCFLDNSLFHDIQFGKEEFKLFFSHKKYVLNSVESTISPATKVDAIAFSVALKESRKLSENVSFHDGIFVEQLSKLLPCWTLTPHVDDDVVLGTWIAGGVIISTQSFRRLSKLSRCLTASDLSEIIKAAGLSVSVDECVLTKQKPVPQANSNVKDSIVRTATNNEPSLEATLVSKEFKLPGRPYLEEFFNEHIIDIIFNTEKYELMGIDFPSAIILHGPPGCGKTFAVERLIEFIDWPSYAIDSNSIGSPYIHETSKKISEVFDKAIDSAPSVIVIDEMESFLSDRRSGSSSGFHHIEEVSEFLRRIPEAIKNKVLIIGMTNMIDMIDPAILRRGRFDHIIEVGMPSRLEVSSLLDSLLNKLPKTEGLNMNKILDSLTGKALSDSAFIVRESARIAARAGKIMLDQDSIDKALNSLPKGVVETKRGIGFLQE